MRKAKNSQASRHPFVNTFDLSDVHF